jgi:uncharacterized protein (TIGR03067 family)
MRKLILPVLTAGIVAVAVAEGQDKTSQFPAKEYKVGKLNGTWAVLNAEVDGELLPENRTKAMRVVFTDTTASVVIGDAKPMFVAKYALNTVQRPNTLDFTLMEGPNRGQVAQGIVEMEDFDTLRLVYTVGTQGRPRSFRTEPGGSVERLFTLKRQKSEVEKGAEAKEKAELSGPNSQTRPKQGPPDRP